MAARKGYQKGITIKLTQRRTGLILRKHRLFPLGMGSLRIAIIPYLPFELTCNSGPEFIVN
jgi:hypothetical protein